jgi:hypothetical protein
MSANAVAAPNAFRRSRRCMDSEVPDWGLLYAVHAAGPAQDKRACRSAVS